MRPTNMSSSKSLTNWSAYSPEENEKKLAALGFSLDDVNEIHHATANRRRN